MRKKSHSGIGVFIGILMTLCILCALAIGLKAWELFPSTKPTETTPVLSETLPVVTETEPVTVATSEAPTTSVTLLAVGDNLIDEDVYKSGGGIYTANLNFDHLYKNVKADIEAADFAAITQETIFVSNVANASGAPQYGSPRQIGEAVADAGFDVILHASEHATDKSVENVFDAIDFWSDKDVTVLGIHDSEEAATTPTVLEKNDIRIGMVDYTASLAKVQLEDDELFAVDVIGDDMDKLIRDVEYCEQNADITVAFLHIGDLEGTKPTTYVKTLVSACIDEGADIIICSHPYALQTYGTQTGSAGHEALVFYSLGSFISAQESIQGILSGMANITIEKTGDVTTVSDYSLTALVTHGADGDEYSVYKLSDYTDELAEKNTLVDCTLDELNEKFEELTK